MKLKYIFVALATPFLMKAQQVMTPEILWTLNKFSVTAVEPQQKGIFYSVGKVNLETEKTNKNHFYLDFGKNQGTAKYDQTFDKIADESYKIQIENYQNNFELYSALVERYKTYQNKRIQSC